MASPIELFLPANSFTTQLLSSTRATNEGIAVLEVWSFFSFAIKRILGIKRIFPCSFANKRMRLLTRVYGILGNDIMLAYMLLCFHTTIMLKLINLLCSKLLCQQNSPTSLVDVYCSYL